MTVEAVERIERPRRQISSRVLVGAFAIMAAGIGAVVAAALFAGGGSSLSPYDAELTPLIAEHNEIVRQWNGFIDEYNGISLSSPELFDARAVDGRALVEKLSTESQGVILAWDRVVPPPEMVGAHQLARDAMRETQDGFIELSTYFGNIVQYGIAFDEDLRAGTSRLDRATEYWAQARAAALIATATN